MHHIALILLAGSLLISPLEAGAQQEREPAATMSYRGAPWLERTEREREERPDEVLDAMQLERGDVVADVGVGSGYFARRVARRVGDEGTVYGVDIQPEMLEFLRQNAAAEGIDNIVPVLGEMADPKLPAGAIDWILLVDVYHELSDPLPMLDEMRAALAPGGRVALLEYRAEDTSGDHIYPDHRMSVRQVLAEWVPAGFTLLELHEFLPSQHMFVFGATSESPGEGLPYYDLFDALDRELIEVEVRGAGREQVGVRIRRTTPERFVVTAAAGTVFRSTGEQRDMLARRDGVRVLDEDGWLRWDIRAVGTGWERDVPDDRDRFELVPPNADPRLAQVARALQAGTYRIGPNVAGSNYTAQTIGVAEAATWIAARDPSYDAVARFLGDRDVPAQYAAAYGLIVCERAGIDIRATRMWGDREAIFSGLQLRELESWYRFRGQALPGSRQSTRPRAGTVPPARR